MNGKKGIIIMCVSSFAIAAFISLTTITYSIKGNNVLAEPLTTTVTNVTFVLKEYEGNLALFRGDSSTPYKKLEVPVSYLTEYDQALVKVGIVKNTEQEMDTVIEDLTS